MEDSDDEIFVGRVTVQELKLVKRCLPEVECKNRENVSTSPSVSVGEEIVLSSDTSVTVDQGSLSNNDLQTADCDQQISHVCISSGDEVTALNISSVTSETHHSASHHSFILKNFDDDTTRAIVSSPQKTCETSDQTENISHTILSETETNGEKIFTCNSPVISSTDVSANNCDSTEALISSFQKSFDTSSYDSKSYASICDNSQTPSSDILAISKFSSPKAFASSSGTGASNFSTHGNFQISTDLSPSMCIHTTHESSLKVSPLKSVSGGASEKLSDSHCLYSRNERTVTDAETSVAAEILPLVNTMSLMDSSSKTAVCCDTSNSEKYEETGAECCASIISNIVSPIVNVTNSDNQIVGLSTGDLVSSLPPCCFSTSNSGNCILQSKDTSEFSPLAFSQKPNHCLCDKNLFSPREEPNFDIDAENGSVLCSSLLDSDTESNKSNLNTTLEELDLMFKHGLDYIVGADDLVLSQSIKNESQKGTAPQSQPKEIITPKMLKQYEYQHVDGGQEEMSSPAFKRELKDYKYTASGTKAFALKTGVKTSCPRQQQVKKMMHLCDIRSPVAAYIKDRPVQLLKTAVKVKSREKGNISPKHFIQEMVTPSVKQRHVSKTPALPEIRYEKAQVINVKQLSSAEKCVPSKKHIATPTVTRHAGRAVLAAVPQNALLFQRAEVSVLYNKDASRTTTL